MKVSLFGLASLLAFVLLSLASIALADDGPSGSSFWVCFLPQLAACVWVGFALRELAWTEGALAIMPVLLALPFGQADSSRGEGAPMALVEGLLTPLNLAFMIAGTLVERRLRSRRRGSA